MARIFVLLMLLIVFYFIVKLQIYLSQKKKLIYGLILPGILFGMSLFFSLSVAPVSYSAETTAEEHFLTEDELPLGEGEKAEGQSDISALAVEKTNQTFFIFSMMVLFNIPTAILLAVLVIYRKRSTARMELEKMKLSEL